jgi:hypothetical protein
MLLRAKVDPMVAFPIGDRYEKRHGRQHAMDEALTRAGCPEFLPG